MLGLLRRLHRMQVQFSMESETNETKIKYPKMEAHKMKDGHSEAFFQAVRQITDKQIAESIESSREDAKKSIKNLGMYDLLHSNNCWENPPTPLLVEVDYDNVDDEDEVDEVLGDSVAVELLQEANSGQDSDDIASGISNLLEAEIITTEQSKTLTSLHRSAFKQIPSSTVPLFEKTSTELQTKQKYSPYVKVQRNGSDLFIHKTTAVWLLQENERLSSDRLFRVRSKQPYATDLGKIQVSCENTDKPFRSSTVAVGDICAFIDSTCCWKIGKILQFSYYKEKSKAQQQYKSLQV